MIGKVKSKESLEDYIDERGEDYKRKFNVDKVYAPNGLEIKKVVTYNEETDSISDIYEKISEKKPFTIKGYRLSIQDGDDKWIFLLPILPGYKHMTNRIGKYSKNLCGNGRI